MDYQRTHETQPAESPVGNRDFPASVSGSPPPAATCVLIGESALLVQCARILAANSFHVLKIVSSDEQVNRFARENDTDTIASVVLLSEFLESHPVDYLFSIVNHRILPAALLGKAKKNAINYHDGPLPRYAGLNATFWALLNGETAHGITWHQMEAGIDTGGILQQEWVAIEPDETSFSLNIKCYEAALRGFAKLTENLTAQVPPVCQNPEHRSYYGGDKRLPHGGVVSWQAGAELIGRLYRASSFGFYRNALGLPKIAVGHALVLVGGVAVSGTLSATPPGTLVAATDNCLTVSTSTKDILIRQVTTLDGKPLAILQWLAAHGLQPGSVLAEMDATLLERIEALDVLTARKQDYWVRKLQKTQPTALPFGNRLPIAGADAGRPHRVSVALPTGMRDFAQAHHPGSSMNDLLAVAFLVYLSRVTGLHDLHVGFASAELHGKLAGLPGFFAGSVPLHTTVNPDDDFAATCRTMDGELQRTRQGLTYALDLAMRYPNLRPNEELRAERVFPVVVAEAETGGGTYPCLGREVTVLLDGNAGTVDFIADPAKLNLAAVRRMADQFAVLLASLLENPAQCTGKLRLLPPPERQKILVEWNHTQRPYPTGTCIHELFERQADRTPDAVAVVCGGQHFSYRELNGRANRLAHQLIGAGVGPQVLVGICVEKSLETVVGVLGIMKAGGAYVPLEPSAPKDRLALVLDDLQLSVLLTQTNLKNKFEGQPFQIIALDAQASDPADNSRNPASGVTADNLAYIIYTSGSTGIPKGVMVRHRPVVNLIDWVNRTFAMNAHDRVLFVNSLGFDLSVYDIFGLLAAGGSVRVASKDELHNPQRLLEILHEEPITLWNSAPATLSQLVPFGETVVPVVPAPLRLAFLSGDWIPMSLPGWLTRHFTQCQVISLGGATEAAVWSNYFPIPRQLDEQWVSIPYGFPIQNAKYHILDAHLQPMPVGVAGELHIGGECLADGYFKRPELNAEKFIADPFGWNAGAKLYRTGDLARYMPDGNIEFLGRKDHQVKIRGYRIELGEIEAALSGHGAVQETVIIACPDASGSKRLVAYVVAKPGAALDVAQLRAFLKDKLPEYMIPALFVLLAAMPLNPSGKIDRRALPPPEPGGTANCEKPRTPAEYLLAGLWAKTLQISEVGIHDHFFEIGGHSLLGVQFIAELQRKTGRSLPLSLLFANPTIASFARLLEEQHDSGIWNSLVAIQTGGEKTPLYCVHPISGGVEYASKLAACLPADQPVYGLQAVGMNGKHTPLQTIPEMAAHYLTLVLGHQPDGPYCLSGYSVGGLIAYEMAQQLQASGKEVATLILFDTYPARSRFVTYDHIGLEYIAQSWAKLMLDFSVPFGQRWQIFRSMKAMQGRFRQTLFSHLKSQARLLGKTNKVAAIQHDAWDKVLVALWQAGRHYRQRPYPGKVVFIRASENIAKHLRKSDFGWQQIVTSKVAVHEVLGDHFSLFKDQQSLDEIADVVQRHLP